MRAKINGVELEGSPEEIARMINAMGGLVKQELRAVSKTYEIDNTKQPKQPIEEKPVFRARRYGNKECLNCGKRLRKTQRKYCSNYCGHIIWGKNNAEKIQSYNQQKKKKLSVAVICRECGKDFATSNTRRVFCSKECLLKSYGKYPTKDTNTSVTNGICLECNASYPMTNPIRKFCSDRCRNYYNNRKKRGGKITSSDIPRSTYTENSVRSKFIYYQANKSMRYNPTLSRERAYEIASDLWNSKQKEFTKGSNTSVNSSVTPVFPELSNVTKIGSLVLKGYIRNNLDARKEALIDISVLDTMINSVNGWDFNNILGFFNDFVKKSKEIEAYFECKLVTKIVNNRTLLIKMR